MRSIAKIGGRQQIGSRDLFDLSGWLVLWKPVGRIMLMIFPVVLIIHMFIGFAVINMDQAISSIDNQRHELMDKNIELLARKASLWSPENIEKLAGEKLELYADSGDQVGKFNRRNGTFVSP
jgi:hypothetical protein